jgi:hypothetical protein
MRPARFSTRMSRIRVSDAAHTRSTAGCRACCRSMLIIVGSVGIRPPNRSVAMFLV